MNNNCNLTTCRYNANGKCENEEKREECVEVSRKVLCLEINDNDGFCGTVEKTGQMVHGEFEVHHCNGIPDRRTFEVYGKLKDFSEISKMTLSTGEILEIYKADGSNRLIEV